MLRTLVGMSITKNVAAVRPAFPKVVRRGTKLLRRLTTVTLALSLFAGVLSVSSASASGPTAPDAPTVTGVTAGNAQVTVAFAPNSDGGSPITGYTVTTYPGGATTPETSSPAVITGLTNGSAYTFTVIATNAIGSSPESTPSSSVTPVATPAAPTALSAQAVSSGETLSWTAAASTLAAPVTGYNVYRAGTLLASVTSTTYTDTAPAFGAMTSYTVASYGAGGVSTAVPVTGYYNFLNVNLGQVTTGVTLSFTPTAPLQMTGAATALTSNGTEVLSVNLLTGASTVLYGSSTAGNTNNTNPALVTFSNITSITTDATYYYVAEAATGCSSVTVRRIEIAGATPGATTTLATSPSSCSGAQVTFGTDGKLYLATDYGGSASTIYTVNLSTGALTTAGTYSSGGTVTAMTQDGTVIYVYSTNYTWSYNTISGVIATVTSPDSGVLAAAGGYLYTSSTGGVNLTQYNIAANTAVTIAGSGTSGVQDGTGPASFPSGDGAWFGSIKGIAVTASGLWVLDGRTVRQVVQGTSSSPAPGSPPPNLNVNLGQVTTGNTLSFTPTAPLQMTGASTALTSNGTEVLSVNLLTGISTVMYGSSTAGNTNSLNPALVTFSNITSITTDGTYYYVAEAATGCASVIVRRVEIAGTNPGATSTLSTAPSTCGGLWYRQQSLPRFESRWRQRDHLQREHVHRRSHRSRHERSR